MVSFRLSKLAFALVLGLLVWMAISAFRPRHLVIDQHSDNGTVIVTLDASRGSHPTTNVERPKGTTPDDKKTNAKQLAEQTPPTKPVKASPSEKTSTAAAQSTPQLAGSVRGNFSGNGAPADHQLHKSTLPPPPQRARRTIDPDQPISVDRMGRANLDWDILASTSLDEKFHPTILKCLDQLDGQPVTLTGFIHPLDEVGEMSSFLLLEYPIGCFYCLSPKPTGLVMVALANARTTLLLEPVRIRGTLHLNRNNPEDFLYSIIEAEIAPIE